MKHQSVHLRITGKAASQIRHIQANSKFGKVSLDFIGEAMLLAGMGKISKLHGVKLQKEKE